MDGYFSKYILAQMQIKLTIAILYLSLASAQVDGAFSCHLLICCHPYHLLLFQEVMMGREVLESPVAERVAAFAKSR